MVSGYIDRLRGRIGKELLQVPSVTAVIFDDDRRILLVHHADTAAWVLPGGSIEPVESPADAVVRETWEETGLLVEPRRILGVYGGPDFVVAYANGDRVSYVMTVFDCAVVGGSLDADGAEIVEARFVTEEKVADLNLAQWARRLLPEILNARTPFSKPTWRPPSS